MSYGKYLQKTMHKYFVVAQNTWNEIMTYRLSFLMWRIRTVLQLLTVYFLWVTLVPSGQMLFGYSHIQMLTYVVGTSVISAIVFSTRTHEIGENINSGNLSGMLLKPVSYFGYWFSRDIGDKLVNVVCSVGEIIIIFLLLRPSLFFQIDPLLLFYTILSVIIAIILYFIIGSLLGMIGFWSPEVWAPRFIFFILIQFFSGSFFPIDIFPKPLFEAFSLLPFPYLLFFPLKIYLGQLSNPEIMQGLTVEIFWIGILSYACFFVWKKGLRIYTAYGN